MRTVKYFVGVCTIEELKKEYKSLAKKYHPDLNLDKDTTKIMVDINNEYEFLFESMKDAKTETQGHSPEGDYRTVVDELIKFDITIDIIGSWVWVYGNTYAIKESLKKLGFRWSGSNKKWYWTEQPMAKRKKAMSYDYKVSKYGKETLKTSKTSKRLV